MFHYALCAVVIVVPYASASAVVQEFFVRANWEAAVGEFTTIDFFDDFPLNTFITDHYSQLGIIFTDGTDRIDIAGPAYPNDGWGLQSFDGIRMDFDVPMTYLGLDHPGAVQFQLFFEGDMFYDSGPFVFGGGGAGFFSGILSSEPFDQVVLIDWIDADINIDDLHFGGAVPAPGALALLAVGALIPCRRRKRCQ